MAEQKLGPRLPVRQPLVVLATVAVLSAALTAAAHAQFTASASESQQLATGTLSPATQPATAPGTCVPDVSDAVVVSWTATTSTWAEGYEVLRATSDTGPYTVVGSASGQPTTSYTDSGLPFGTTYHYQVRAKKHEWRSTSTATVSRTTRTSTCS